MVKKENVLFDAGVQMTPFWSFSLLSVHSPSTPWQNEKWMNAWEVSTVARVPLSLQIIFISNFFECVFRSHFFFCCRNFISYKNILFFRITFAKGRRAGDSIRDAGGKKYSLELIRAPGTPPPPQWWINAWGGRSAMYRNAIACNGRLGDKNSTCHFAHTTAASTALNQA